MNVKHSLCTYKRNDASPVCGKPATNMCCHNNTDPREQFYFCKDHFKLFFELHDEREVYREWSIFRRKVAHGDEIWRFIPKETAAGS